MPLRVQGVVLSALFTGLSAIFAVLACDANGKTVNMPAMHVAVLLSFVAFIAMVASLLATER